MVTAPRVSPPRLARLRDRGRGRSSRWFPSADRGGKTLVAVRLVALVATVLVCGPARFLVPSPTLDAGWMTSIAWSRQLGLHFGPDIVFTYGPWGSLAAPMDLGTSLSWLAMLFAVASLTVFWTFAESALRPVVGWLPAILVASFATFAVYEPNTASWPMVLGLVGRALTLLSRRRRANPSTHEIVAYGIALGLLLQVKFSEGLIVAIVAAMVVVREGVRVWVVAVTSLVVAFVAWWLAAGQSLWDIPQWFRLSIWVAAGYQDAMYYEDPSRAWVWPFVILGLAMVALLIVQQLWLGGWSLFLPVAVAGVTVFGLKQGFVRHDRWHEPAFYSVLVTVALSWLPRRRLAAAPRLLLAVIACVSGLLVFRGPALLPHGDWSGAARAVFDPEFRAQRLAKVGPGLQAAYGLSPQMLSTIGNRPVQVEPYESGLAWAYHLNWHPVPIFQPYSAYEPALDRANTAGLLAEPDQTVLRENATLDDRVQLWDSPRYNRALVCHFVAVAQEARWSVLERVGNRCGRPRELLNQRVRPGEQVTVPLVRGDQMVTMRFHPERRSLARTLAGLVCKDPQPLTVAIGSSPHRLPRSLAGGPLMLTLPADATWSANSELLNMAKTVTFSERGTLSFEVTRVREAQPRLG